MSEDNNNVVYQTPEEAREQLEDEEKEQWEQFQEWQKEKMRKAGIHVPDSDLGESVHKETVQSYKALNLEVPDNVRLTTLRPGETMRRTMSEVQKAPVPT